VENKREMLEAKNIPLSKCTDSMEQIFSWKSDSGSAIQEIRGR
jgi:hypothetical protein